MIALAATASACAVAVDADDVDCTDGKCDDGNVSGEPRAFAGGQIASGAALYVAHCRQDGGVFACFPTLMQFDPTTPTGVRTVALPRVDQPQIAPAPTFKAAVIDTTHGLAYLHGGCTGTYIVTDLRTGTSRVFPTPGTACLQALVHDAELDRVVAIGGAVSGGDNSTIDSVVELGPAGELRVLFDLRAQVSRGVGYLHPFKELVSFDSRRGLAYTPLLDVADPGGARRLLRVNVDTGAAAVLPWTAGIQHQFYDASTDTSFAYDCRVPDMLRVDGFSPMAFTSLFGLSFGALSIDTICRNGFTAAAYDEAGKRDLILFRTGDAFSIAVSDMQTRQFLGLFPTDATAATFRSGPLSPTTFWSAGFVPPLGGGGGGAEIVRTSADTPIAIPDNRATGITSTINVGDAGVVGGVVVDVDITHTWRGDLFVSLICPDATRVPLHQGAGGSADNLIQSFPVTACNGRTISGAWKLEVSDRAAADVGRLNRWTIHIR